MKSVAAREAFGNGNRESRDERGDLGCNTMRNLKVVMRAPMTKSHPRLNFNYNNNCNNDRTDMIEKGAKDGNQRARRSRERRPPPIGRVCRSVYNGN